MTWSLVETCAGSAALTVHLLGGRNALLPYQGSKWKVRGALENLLRDSGVQGPPSTVWLNDMGPFGRTWSALSTRAGEVADLVEQMARQDPKEVFERLHRYPVPDSDIPFAAQHLFLQRLSHSGKAVAVTRKFWNSPGFNKTSAYGFKGTERFGPIKPMLPHLIRSIRDTGALFEGVRTTCTSHDLRSFSGPRTPFHELLDEGDPVVFLIDPPYRGTTGYSSRGVGFTRENVIELAEKLLLSQPKRPVLVILCEAEPIALEGALLRELKEATSGESPFRSTRREVATWACSTGWPTPLPRRASAQVTGVVSRVKKKRSKVKKDEEASP